MRIPGLGLEIRRTPKILEKRQGSLSPVSERGGWWPLIRESVTGAWQRNITITAHDVLSDTVIFACITMIAGDIAKLWLKLVVKDDNGISTETDNPAYSPVLRKPNTYQTRNKFVEYWFLSKLTQGNTFVLKERDNRGVVARLHILDPQRVQVLVAHDGSVWYNIYADDLAGIDDDVIVPAREIIHDMGYPLHHPLVGVSPLRAAGRVANQRLTMQDNSTKFFANGSQPGGVVTLEAALSNENIVKAQENWEAQFAGPNNIGKVAFLAGGAQYHPLAISNHDSQLIDIFKWSAEMICMCYHVPPYKLGIGPAPPYTDIQSIQLEYYNLALHPLIENFETLMTEGLELNRPYSIEVDTKALLRMDTRTQVDNATKSILGGLVKPNEARADFDLKPVVGGDTVYLQNQQYSLAALSRRDNAEPAPASPGLAAQPSEPQKALPPVLHDEDGTPAFLAALSQTALRTDFYDAA